MPIAPSPEKLVIGYVGTAYGIQGWIKVSSFTEPPENILSYNPWLVEIKGVWQDYHLLQGHKHGKSFIVQLANCQSREQAALLQGTTIAILPNQLSRLKPDQFYWYDLLGLKVINCENVDLGYVAQLMETGANDVLIVVGDKKRLIPYLPEQVIKNIDLEKKLILADWDPEF